MNATNTLHAVILEGRGRLERAGIEPVEAALDAELLARHALGGWERGQLIANWREPAPAGFGERFDPLVERRERREPTAYITGHREFWGIEIEVEPGVLIPRPETEFIVEEALARLTPDARQPASETTVLAGSPESRTPNPEPRLVSPDARPLDGETTVPPRPRSHEPAKRVMERRVLQTDAVGSVRGAASEAVLPLEPAAAPAGFSESRTALATPKSLGDTDDEGGNPACHAEAGLDSDRRKRESRPAVPLLRIADVGTGSGCLAIALARWLPTACAVATDISADALAIAARNIVRHEVQDRVSLVHCDLLDATAGPFDLIVSNPPYIPSGDMASLQPEILVYEPTLALEAGPDGLDLIRRLVPMAADRLTPGGWLIFEFGDGQAAGVREIIAAEPRLAVVALRDDLAGIPRVAVARHVKA
jgi:methylase of polypeptide subunit release factors